MDRDADDSALMTRYSDGDLAAFETLYRRHKDALYRFLLRLTGRHDMAEDVFQDAWGKIIHARNSYRPTARFRTFLFHVARNCHVDHLRRNRRHEHGAGEDPDRCSTAEPDPEVHTEHALLRRRLDRALAGLPAEQREAWLLHEEGGLNAGEIGTITGVNRETAKSRVRYAARKLRELLEEPAARSGAGPGSSSADLGKVGTP